MGNGEICRCLPTKTCPLPVAMIQIHPDTAVHYTSQRFRIPLILSLLCGQILPAQDGPRAPRPLPVQQAGHSLIRRSGPVRGEIQ